MATCPETPLAIHMLRRGLKQVDVMRMTRLSKRTVASAYYGRHVSDETKATIARKLGLSLAELDPAAAARWDGFVVR